MRRSGADAVAAIALAPASEQFAYELTNYKREATSAGIRERFTVGLAAVLWMWLGRHEACLASAVEVTAFPVITTVPTSSSGRTGPHPLARVVTGVVAGSGDRYRELLQAGEVAVGQRDFSVERFVARERLSGEAVLLIDDTWTTGAHMHGAAAALKAAGAGPVGALAIGRWYHPLEPANSAVEAQRRRRHWRWDECMLDT